ncbi:hypothetical protein EV214_13139 [Marinisporobacter balticus]|uniref:Uncharacterized protein n=2 Tax=Marinisporobacter balticus TaxID=2018667 RepID=A0A4R2KS81_9FIRM|nr:hypothetical protein EV214_13139 [Marinisporobacter balticus]
MGKYKFNTRWNEDELKCACLFGNPGCDRFKTCETLELTLNPYGDIEECMKARKYKRKKGALRQMNKDG